MSNIVPEHPKRIGIFGGTFDPVHFGHLMIAEAAYLELSLDEVVFIPAGTPPFKRFRDGLAEGDRRAQMVRLAIAGNPHFSYSSMEMDRNDISYTYITLQEYKEQHPYDQLFFLMGEDSLFDFLTWKEPEKIARMATLCLAGRAGAFNSDDAEHEKKVQSQIDKVKLACDANIVRLHTPLLSISSTDIRERIRQGESIRYIVPDTVCHYIVQNGLYSEEESADDGRLHAAASNQQESAVLFDVPEAFADIERVLEEILPDKRMRHTRGVCYTAASLAMAHGENVRKAALAGLLHDCAKYMEADELLSYCQEQKIPVSGDELISPKLLHAKVGASIANMRFGIEDEDILRAITYHTTGRPHMTLLEKIVYTADAIEPHRTKMTGLPVYRHLAFTDLDQCVYRIMADTLEYLHLQQKNIDKTTQEAYDFYKNNLYGDKE